MRGWAHQKRLHKSKLYVCDDKKSLPVQRSCSLSQKKVTSPFEHIFSCETMNNRKIILIREEMRSGNVPRVITAKFIETSSLPVEGCYLGIYKVLWQLSRLSLEVLAVTRELAFSISCIGLPSLYRLLLRTYSNRDPRENWDLEFN